MVKKYFQIHNQLQTSKNMPYFNSNFIFYQPISAKVKKMKIVIFTIIFLIMPLINDSNLMLILIVHDVINMYSFFSISKKKNYIVN